MPGAVQRAFDRCGRAGVHPGTEIGQLPKRCARSFGPIGGPEVGRWRGVVVLARYLPVLRPGFLLPASWARGR